MTRFRLLPGLLVLVLLGLGASGSTHFELQQKTGEIGPGPGPLPRPLPTSLPDLTIQSLVLNSDNSFTIVVGNSGIVDVPAGQGRLSLFVDGKPVLDVALTALPDQEFRTAGLSTAFDTGVILYGEDRRISVIVDATDEVEELDEIQNSRSVTLTAFNFGQSDLEPVLGIDGDGFIWLEIQNNGRAASPGGVEVRLNIELDGFPVRSSSFDLDPIEGGDSVSVDPDELRVVQPTPISATLEFSGAYTDGDTTNNRDTSILPEPSLEKYDYLFADPTIRSHLIFETLDATYDGYDEWPQDLKDDLNVLLVKFEQETADAGVSPPATYEYNYFTPHDVRGFYLAQVAQSFWVDANDIVPWNLQDLGNEIRNYLDFREQFTESTSNKYYFRSAAVNWNPHGLYRFLANRQLIRSTRLDTLYALTRYLRRHLLHQLNHPPEQKWGYSSVWAPVERVLYPVPGQRHWTAGCWGTSGLIKAVLKSINVHTETDQTMLSTGSHATPYFPEERLRIVHGDDLYEVPNRPWLGVIPTEMFFLTESEYDQLIDTGEVDCDSAGDCNSPGEQNSQAYARRFRLMAMQALPGHFLQELCREGPARLEEILTGGFAQPYLGTAERAEFLARASLKISDLGSGDTNAGCEYVNTWRVLFSNLGTPVVAGFNLVPYFTGKVYTDERYEPPGEFMTFRMPAFDPGAEQLRFSAETLPGDASFGGLGDVDFNGGVDSADASLLQQFLDEVVQLSPAAQARADVNGDDALSEEDVAMIDQAASSQALLNTGVFTWEVPVVGDYVVTFVVSDGSYDYELQLRVYIREDFS